jgi:hypothetical protein
VVGGDQQDMRFFFWHIGLCLVLWLSLECVRFACGSGGLSPGQAKAAWQSHLNEQGEPFNSPSTDSITFILELFY